MTVTASWNCPFRGHSIITPSLAKLHKLTINWAPVCYIQMALPFDHWNIKCLDFICVWFSGIWYSYPYCIQEFLAEFAHLVLEVIEMYCIVLRTVKVGLKLEYFLQNAILFETLSTILGFILQCSFRSKIYYNRI